MLPVLDVRADMLASGKPVQPTSLHDYFIYAEVGKLILIVGGILLQLKDNNNGKYRKMSGHWLLAKLVKSASRRRKRFNPENAGITVHKYKLRAGANTGSIG